MEQNSVPLDQQQSVPLDQQQLVEQSVTAIRNSLPPVAAAVVRSGAIPRWFDVPLLTTLVGSSTDLDLGLAVLARLSFVRQDAQGRFRYHAAVRDVLLAWWRRAEPAAYRLGNRRAVTYFTSAIGQVELTQRPVYEQEVLYHLLIDDEEAGIHYLAERYEALSAQYQLGIAERFVASAAQVVPILSPTWGQWVRYFQARLDLDYQRDDAGEAVFTDLMTGAADSVLAALAGWSLSELWIRRHRGLAAITTLQTSLSRLQQAQAWTHAARIMVTLSHAYVDMANSSGGFTTATAEHYGAPSLWLHRLQHLPFWFYEQLVHRLAFLPNWYFGTNYQDWIVAYLFKQAEQWSRRAQAVLATHSSTLWSTVRTATSHRSTGDQQTRLGAAPTLPPVAFDIALALAETEHRTGRWARAHRRYAHLLTYDEVVGSLYRQARVQLGQGRALYAEGIFSDAMTALDAALAVFQQFHDNSNTGAAALWLGRTQARLGNPTAATVAYLTSITALTSVGDDLTRTQALDDLEALTRQQQVADELHARASAMLAEVTTRHYSALFPDRLLTRFRRLALWVAAPFTYLLAFVIAVALIFALLIIETVIVAMPGGIVGVTLADSLLLTTGIIVPIAMALWLYRAVYSFVGALTVWWLGHRLVPIAAEPPTYFITNPTGIRRIQSSRGTDETTPWSAITEIATIDYRQWQRPITLISRTVLVTHLQIEVVIDAITNGYEQLRRAILRHRQAPATAIRRRDYDFVIFAPPWIIGAFAVALSFALYVWITGGSAATSEIGGAANEYSLRLTSIAIIFTPAFLLLFPAQLTWRLAFHLTRLRRELGREYMLIPLWMIWTVATLATLLALLGVSLLFAI